MRRETVVKHGGIWKRVPPSSSPAPTHGAIAANNKKGYTVNPTTKSVFVFSAEKETAGTFRYAEFIPSGDKKDAVITSLYVKKGNPLAGKATLTATLEEDDGSAVAPAPGVYVLKFNTEKETAGTHRFAEVPDSGDKKDAVLGTLYVKKGHPLSGKAKLRVTLSEAKK